MKQIIAKKDLEYLASIEAAEQDNLQALKNIVEGKTHGKLKFNKGGGSAAVDVQSANAILTLYNALSEGARVKLERMINNSLSDYAKVFDFAWKKVSVGNKKIGATYTLDLKTVDNLLWNLDSVKESIDKVKKFIKEGEPRSAYQYLKDSPDVLNFVLERLVKK